MTTAKIRKARPGDEEQIAKVQVQSWQETYRGLISQSYLDQMSEELDERGEMWVQILKSPNRWAWVAEVSGQIVGFILFGPARDKNHHGEIELGAVYLLAHHHGQGIGYSLLSTGFEFMKGLGYRKAYCWVLEGNPTIRFYERTGSIFLGETKTEETGGEMLKELAYEWDSLEISK